jgi:hypothetical protein
MREKMRVRRVERGRERKIKVDDDGWTRWEKMG